MCERHYTPSVIAEMQAVSLAVELRRRAKEAQKRMAGTSELGRGIDAGMEMLIMWLEELAPAEEKFKHD
jgi:hypothetical protein